jgi:tripeptidyl-peptidase-1
MPDYQKDAVDAWRQHTQDHGSGFLKPSSGKGTGGPGAGRGYPDITALSYKFSTYMNGELRFVTGTSAATPVVAGIFSVLNHNRQVAGKPPLGFLNQLIYQAPAETWNDIRQGNNPGCSNKGFHATPGWDPVSGVGSPNIQSLRRYIEELQ